MISGGFVIGTATFYSFLVVLNYPSLEECNQAQLKIHGDSQWYTEDMTCFKTYKPIYQSIAPPLPRPKNLKE